MILFTVLHSWLDRLLNACQKARFSCENAVRRMSLTDTCFSFQAQGSHIEEVSDEILGKLDPNLSFFQTSNRPLRQKHQTQICYHPKFPRARTTICQ